MDVTLHRPHAARTIELLCQRGANLQFLNNYLGQKFSAGVSSGAKLCQPYFHLVHDLNTMLSLIGFCVNLYVLFAIKNIKATFLVKARLPSLIKDLCKTGSTFNELLSQWPGQRNEARGQVTVSTSGSVAVGRDRL